MINKRLRRLAEFTSVIPANPFEAQRLMLAEFSQALQLKFRVLVVEMEQDIHILKERGFDKGVQKIFYTLWNDVRNIAYRLDQQNPYEVAQKFVTFVKTKSTRDIVSNLDFLTKHHLKQTNVDFRAGPVLKHPEIRSLQLLNKLADYLDNYMKTHPLMSNTSISTQPISLLNMSPEEPAVLSPQDQTGASTPFSKQKV